MRHPHSYVNVDEGWLKGRDNATGEIISDDVKFPSGMKALGDWIHSQEIPGSGGKHLLYGLYTSRGTVQCGTSAYHAVGSQGFEKQDSQWFADAGADYAKIDSCGGSQNHTVAFGDYGRWRDGFNATGRSIAFSLCGWHDWYAPVGQSLGNSWRIAGDGQNWAALTNCINTDAPLARFAGPGGWNDPDLLQWTGEGSYGPGRDNWYQTELQSRSQFSMWSVLAAPLIMSADITSLSQYQLETWGNEEVIAVNQDPMGRQGIRAAGYDLAATSGTNVWGRPLADGSWALVFVSNDPAAGDITCDGSCFAQMPFPAPGSQARRDWVARERQALVERSRERSQWRAQLRAVVASPPPLGAADAPTPSIAGVTLAECASAAEHEARSELAQAQLWTVPEGAAGHIVSTSSGGARCLDVWQCGTANGSPVETYTCASSDGGGDAAAAVGGSCGGANQQWTLRAVTLGSANMTITSGLGTCLDQWDFTDTQVDSYACNGGSNQQWIVMGSKSAADASGSGAAPVMLRNAGSGLCLTSLPATHNQTLSVRDLWAHAAAPDVSTDGMTAKGVPGEGGCAMFKLSLSP